MGLGSRGLFALATSERFERTVKRAPGGESAAWRAASRYVAGRSSAAALQLAERLPGRRRPTPLLWSPGAVVELGEAPLSRDEGRDLEGPWHMLRERQIRG